MLPTILPYNNIKNGIENVTGKYCYIIEPYKAGFAILIKRLDGEITVQVGDWEGKVVEPIPIIVEYLKSNLNNLVAMMQSIKIPQMQIFVSDEGLLVDVAINPDKWISPGMLRDLFSNVVPTQKVRGIEVIKNPPGIKTPAILKTTIWGTPYVLLE